MSDNIACNIKNIYNASKIILEALRQGQDIVQFCNGDIIATKIIINNAEYVWDPRTEKMIVKSS